MSGSQPARFAIDLCDRKVWVTGASRGLGRAVAIGFARAGAHVAVTARTAAALAQVSAEVQSLGRACLPLPFDVADAGAVTAAAAAIGDAWGRLDVLVNCAGISPVFTRAERIDDAVWREVLDVNVTGTFSCARAAAALMTDGGAIVNVSSIHGQVGMPRMAAYSTSKGAVDALTKTLALEWAEREIRVNAVSPGYIETDMTEGLRNHPQWRQHLLDRVPMGRFATPEDLVDAVVFLASDSAAYITGANFVIDGGWTAA